MDPRQILESEEEPSLAVQVESIQARLDRLDQLERSGESPDEDGSALCAELRRLLGQTLHALSRGELRRPAQVARALEPVEWFVEKHLPDPDLSIESLARELFSVLETLRLAADAADIPAFEAGVRDKSLSATHRAVLQVLLDASVAGSGHLRSADVKRLSGLGVSEQHVGRVLLELHERRLVIRTPWPTEGGEMVPFYTLTDEGLGVCERVGLALRPEQRTMVLHLAHTLFSEAATEDDRILARGTLANLRLEWRPQIMGLLQQHFADELAAPIDGILESMTRTSAVMNRSSRRVPHAPKSDTTPPPGNAS